MDLRRQFDRYGQSVTLSAKAGASVIILYVVALVIQGDTAEVTEIFQTMQNFVQDIAAMDPGTLTGAAMVILFVWIIFQAS